MIDRNFETKESHEATMARLDERMLMMSEQLSRIAYQLEIISKTQTIQDRAFEQLPEIKSSVDRAHENIGCIRRGINHVRWFFMGVGAAFGFLGGAISDTVRNLFRVFMDG